MLRARYCASRSGQRALLLSNGRVNIALQGSFYLIFPAEEDKLSGESHIPTGAIIRIWFFGSKLA